jgi:hypothetical protein
VAEELGQARLVLTLDDGPLRKGLQDAKRLIEQELGGAVGTATRRGTTGGRAGGGRTGRQAAESINSEIAANRTLRQLRSSLNKLEAEGVNTVQLRVRFFQIEKQVNDSLFGSARRNSELLKQQITDEKLKLDLQRQQLKILNDAASAGRGTGPSSSIRGSRLLAGSPANLEFLARQGGPTSPIRGGAGFPGSPIAIQKAADAERRRTRELERGRQALERQTAAERRQRQQQEKAGRERLTGALSNAIIGGAFPLLFGQGVGAAAGGGLGGAAGGLLGGQFGFGLSLVGTALGTAFDTALQKAQSLAEGLENPIKNFDALKEAALLSSRGLEKQVEALIEAGRSGEAYALIQADLAASFDDASAAKEYRDAVDNLNREWSRATTTLATFVAGPLAEFLENLRVSAGGKPQDAKEQQLQREQQQALAKTFTFVGTLTSVLGAAVALTPAAPAGIATVGVGATLTGIGRGISDAAAAKEAAALSEDLVALAAKAEASFQRIQAARQRDFEIQRLGNKAVIENIRGNEQLASSDQKRRIELEKIRALEQATPEAREAVEADFNQQLAVLEENRIKNQRDLNVEIFKEVQTRNAIQRSIESTEQLLGTQRGAYRDTLRTVQQIQESIAKAREEETRIGFEIDQARLAGREQEASRLVDQQRTAALQTRAALVEGAQALKEAAETARDNFRDAVLNLTKIRSDPGGLNRFLTPGRQRQRAEQDTAALLPLFRQAQEQFFKLTGQRAPEFRGPREGVNEAIRDFINTVNAEREANLAVQNARAATDLIKTNRDLLEANIQLAVATAKLAEKQWLVDVNVVNQAGGASTVNAVTSLAS